MEHDHKDDNSAPEKSSNPPNFWLIAIGHGLFAMGIIGLFLSLATFDPPSFLEILRWTVYFGLAAAGIVLVRQKESFQLTAGVAAIGCALWLFRS